MKRSWFLIIFILITLSLFYIFTHIYVVFAGLIVVLGLIVTSIIILFLSQRKLKLALHRGWSAEKYQKGLVYLNIYQQSIFPLLNIKCSLRIYNTLTKTEDVKTLELSISGKETRKIPIALTSEYIGEIIVTIDHVRLYDYFNLFAKMIYPASETSIFVLPTYFKTNLIKAADRYAGQYISYATSNSLSRLDGGEMLGLKEYTEGEDIRHIHWKLSSKFDKPIVKELSDSFEDNILVFYETQTEHVDPVMIHAKVEVFMSFSRSLIDERYPHTVGWFDHTSATYRFVEVRSFEQWLSLQRIFLSIEHKKYNPSTFEYFANVPLESYSHVIYITSNDHIPFDTRDQLVVLKCVDYFEDSNLNGNTFIPFTPWTYEHDLSEVVI